MKEVWTLTLHSDSDDPDAVFNMVIKAIRETVLDMVDDVDGDLVYDDEATDQLNNCETK